MLYTDKPVPGIDRRSLHVNTIAQIKARRRAREKGRRRQQAASRRRNRR